VLLRAGPDSRAYFPPCRKGVEAIDESTPATGLCFSIGLVQALLKREVGATWEGVRRLITDEPLH
jgi:hypothetical protein